MNSLSVAKRSQIVSCLIEGNSLRSTTRMTGVHRTTIQKLLVNLGTACSQYQDQVFKNLHLNRIQCDEIWCFIGCKQKHASPEQIAKGWGDIWTWTALDSETKLVPCWLVGKRDSACAYIFINDLASRLSHRVQLTTDGHKAYVEAVEGAFGANIDYAMLVKIYGNDPKPGEARYSPAQCIGAKKAVIQGNPNSAFISTSHTERQNLTMRMSMRRFTRYQCLFEESGESGSCCCASLYALQFRKDSHDLAHHPGNGCWSIGSCLVH